MISEQQIRDMELALMDRCADAGSTLRAMLQEASEFMEPGVLMCLVHAISAVDGALRALAGEDESVDLEADE